MAGGEGAKERRRLKRLAAHEEKNKSANSPQTTIAKENSKNKNTRGINNNKRASNFIDAKRRKPDDGQQRFNKNGHHRRTENNPKHNIKKLKKPKIKKPKHLKRKLDQASSENEEAKGVIQKEIEQFEAKKNIYSKRNKNNKRQKTIVVDSVDRSNNSTDDGAVSRLNEINKNHSPFQRSEKVEIKKPAVIEDDNIEMTDHKETTKPKDKIMKDVPTTSDAEPEQYSTHSSTDYDSSNGGSVDEDADGKTFSESIEHDNRAEKSDKSCDNDGGNSNSESDDDSDDDTDDNEPIQQRQRGRKRRGRQDTAKKIEEMEAVEKSQTATSSDTPEDNSINNGKKRYCIGRKPVTDFVVGQSQPAKVVYAKPFGVFFDIGCHSDAFCHVSRLSDDFVESPESKFKEGDEVPKVRIVEIDRKQKRITISLQSDARIEDERQSIEARKSRKEKSRNKAKKTASIGSSGHDRSDNYSRFNNKTTPVSKEPVFNRAAPTPVKKNLDPSMMTPAELKRTRKLARRAERRAQAEQQSSD